MDHNILDAPDAQVTLDAVVLGNTGWTLRKLLHRNATDPEPGARRRAATRALVELFIEQRMENNRLGSELAQARRDHNAALSRYETEASRAASLEAERDRAQQAAQAAQAKVATLTTQVAELTASKESALAKLAKEREAPTDLRDTSFRRLSDITIVGEDGPTGSALEREQTPAVTTEPKRAPIEPWGLVREDDDDEQGKPIPVWPDAFPMKLITDRAVPEGEVLMITDEQVAEPITQEQLDAARQYARAHAEWFVRENPPKLPPEPRLVDPPKLSFAPESRPTYEHEVTGWLSETEFRTKLRTAGEHGWKLVSHTMDLTDNTHFCVFGRRA